MFLFTRYFRISSLARMQQTFFEWPKLFEILPKYHTWLNLMDSNYSHVNKIDQPIDLIDIDTPTLEKITNTRVSVTFINIFIFMHNY